MRLFDTHGHLADAAFDPDRAAVLERMRAAGVRRAVVVGDPCDDPPSAEAALALAEAHDFLYAAVGVHPHNASGYGDAVEARLLSWMARPKCRLWGEIGLDYHYDLSPRAVQREVFARQLDLAYAQGKPVQLHIREAHGDCMDLLKRQAAAGRMPAGIMHCYTGSWEAAKRYLDWGLYISLSGAVTFKNAPKLAEVARGVPADRLLIETDCPYMAPVPLRGRRNEPAFTVHTFEKVAQLRQAPPEALARQLWENACRALDLPEVAHSDEEDFA